MIRAYLDHDGDEWQVTIDTGARMETAGSAAQYFAALGMVVGHPAFCNGDYVQRRKDGGITYARVYLHFDGESGCSSIESVPCERAEVER